MDAIKNEHALNRNCNSNPKNETIQINHSNNCWNKNWWLLIVTLNWSHCDGIGFYEAIWFDAGKNQLSYGGNRDRMSS